MSVNLFRRPRLRRPYMLAAWPGIGYVATSVALYIKEALGAEELAEIEPYEFFRPNSVLVKNNVISVQEVSENPLPQSKFYYWKNKLSDHDLIIFIGEAQPLGREWEFARLIMDVVQRFKVERIFTSAAAVASISYSQQPAVWAAATGSKLLNYLKQYNVVLRDKIKVDGLNGLLLGVAKEEGIDGICLLGEVPFYIAQLEIEYPKSSRAIMEVLTEMLEIKVDMSTLNQLVDHAETEMKELEEEVIHKMGQIVVYPQNSEDEAGAGEEVTTGEVSPSVRQKIEQLFDQVAKDKSKAGQLKVELDRWKLFDEYEDRFLNIFRKMGG